MRTVNFTDMYTGWVFPRAVRNNAHVRIRAAFDLFNEDVPYLVTGIDCDNGSEFINHGLIERTGQKEVFFTPLRQSGGIHYYGLELDRCQLPEPALLMFSEILPLDPGQDREAQLLAGMPGSVFNDPRNHS